MRDISPDNGSGGGPSLSICTPAFAPHKLMRHLLTTSVGKEGEPGTPHLARQREGGNGGGGLPGPNPTPPLLERRHRLCSWYALLTAHSDPFLSCIGNLAARRLHLLRHQRLRLPHRPRQLRRLAPRPIHRRRRARRRARSLLPTVPLPVRRPVPRRG